MRIQVKLLHAYQDKRPEGFAATSLDEIKMLNNSQEAEFCMGSSTEIGSGDGGIEINCGRTVQAIRPSS